MNGRLLLGLVAVVAVAAADVSAHDEGVARMMAWALANGAAVHPAVRAGQSPERGRGLFAASPITARPAFIE